jgi:multidrug efflux system membrane fusion protein
MRTTLTLAALLAIGCHSVKAAHKPVRPVKVQAAAPATEEQGIRYSATTRPNTQVTLAFRVGGYVRYVLRVRGKDGKWRPVQDGDRVKRGTVLAMLRQTDYRVKVQQAGSQLSQALAAAKQTETSVERARAGADVSAFRIDEAKAGEVKATQDHERVRRLHETQALTQADLDASTARLDSQKATLGAAQASLSEARAGMKGAIAQRGVAKANVEAARALLEDAELALSDTALRAPMDAVVLRRDVEVGTLAAPGTPAFVLADLRTVKAVFGVPDLMLPKIRLGTMLPVQSDVYPGETFTGRVTRISTAADAMSRVFEIEVTLPNARGRFRAGMIVSLRVGELDPNRNLPVVPLSAIVRPTGKTSGYAVLVLTKEGVISRARERVVELGEPRGNGTAIRKGLQNGENVIVSGASFVRDGERVEVIR